MCKYLTYGSSDGVSQRRQRNTDGRQRGLKDNGRHEDVTLKTVQAFRLSTRDPEQFRADVLGRLTTPAADGSPILALDLELH